MSTRLQNAVLIDRPIEAVFDVVTSMKYWPDWHPTCLGVSGQLQTPGRLGDEATERVRIGPIRGQVSWVVTRCERPWHWAIRATRIDMPLMSGGTTNIEYELATSSNGTLFARTHSYTMPNLLTRVYDQVRFRRNLERDTVLAAQLIKDLVERVVAP